MIGPALSLIPIDPLRLIVGALLAVFGLQWLRKAILRASGYKEQHDEAGIYAREIAAARTASGRPARLGPDWYAFTLSFKGVLLEGLEVVFIAITFGAAQSRIALAALAAAAAVVVVVVAGFVRAAAALPGPGEHTEVRCRDHAHLVRHLLGRGGVGASWPGGDSALLAIIAFMALGSAAIVVAVRPPTRRPRLPASLRPVLVELRRRRQPPARARRGRDDRAGRAARP